MLPEGIPTVTVTGRYLRPDGTPLTGQVVFRAPALITFAAQDVILGGPVTAPLDAQGAFEVVLPATDAPGMNPSGWSYTVAEQFATVAQNRSYQILLPAATPTVDIADIAPTDPSTPTYVAVRGDSAYEVAVDNGFIGTVEEWLASLVGPVGPAGSVTAVNTIAPDAGGNVTVTAGDVNALPDTGIVAGGSLFLDSTGGPGYRGFNFRTDTLRRWVFQVDNGAESGGDVGSDFELAAWSDADTWKSPVLFGKRSTGALGIGTNTLAAGAKATVAGPVALADGTAPAAAAGHALLYSNGGQAYVRQADGTIAAVGAAETVIGETGRQYRLISAAIRNTGTGWALINDTGHQPSGITGVVTQADHIEIQHDVGGSRVSSWQVTADETFAATGLRVGASVGVDSSLVYLYNQSPYFITDHVYYDTGTSSWKSAGGVYTGFAFSGGILTLTHADMGTDGPSAAVAGRGAVGAFVGNLTATTTQVVFYTGSFGSLTAATTPVAGMNAYITRYGRRAVPAAAPSGVVSASGNLWITALIEV